MIWWTIKDLLRGMVIGAAVMAVVLIILVAIVTHHRAGSPGPVIPHPVNTRDPLWIIHHCNIPAIRKAHDLLCP